MEEVGEKMQEEIKLSDVYQILKRRSKAILFTTVGFLIITTLLLLFVIEPQYVSKAQLLVGNDSQQQETNDEEVDHTIDRNISLINTYTDIVEGTSVLNEAANILNDQYSVAEIESAIQVEHTFNSQLFSITATMSDQHEAQAVLNAVIIAFNNRVSEIYGDNNTLVRTISTASFSPNKVSPNEVFISFLGLMFGVSVGILIAFGLELRETTIIDETFFIDMNVLQLGKIYDMDDDKFSYSSS
ncbi:YveK family protein [Aerococcaceae bacterium WGS1372]